jgi:UDP-N-acetylglucosamine 4-epimerase
VDVFNSLKEHLVDNQYKWLITGVSGFIGSNLLESLLKLNQNVRGLDNFVTGKKENLEEVKKLVSQDQWKNFDFVEGDICNLQECYNVTNGIDFVLHQAALGSVPRSIESPIISNKVNIEGFLNMMVASRDNGIKSFVYAASSSTYGDSKELPKVEHNIGKPMSTYAVTKLVNEIYADVFKRNYDFNSIGLRYFNVFGKRQDPQGDYAAVIPKWISALINNETVYINGDGETSRDFCYVENVVQANIIASSISSIKISNLDNPEDSMNQIYNIAVGEKTTLTELYSLLRKSLSIKFPHIERAEPQYRDFRQGDVKHSLANISKASNLLGYKPSHRIKDGLKEALEWYTKNLSK